MNVTSLLYADDVVLINSCPNRLQTSLTKLDETCKTFGMKVSYSKTKVMKIGRKQETINLKLGSNEIEQVSQFTYLGTVFSEDGKLNNEIQNRTNKANAVGFQLSRCFFSKKEVSERTKLVVYNSIFRPVLTYGCES